MAYDVTFSELWAILFNKDGTMRGDYQAVYESLLLDLMSLSPNEQFQMLAGFPFLLLPTIQDKISIFAYNRLLAYHGITPDKKPGRPFGSVNK